jgi:hypothetical protein
MRFYKEITVILILIVSGCIGVDKIGDILKNPDQYNGKDVISQGAYKVDDGTGSIWVVTSTGTPGKGETLSVKGTVNKGFAIGSTNLGTVIVEKSRN